MQDRALTFVLRAVFFVLTAYARGKAYFHKMKYD